MKIRAHYTELETLKRRMGASDSSWSLAKSGLSPRSSRLAALNTGIDLDLADVEVGPGGILIHDGEQIVVHIKDTQKSKETNLHNPEDSVRFHLADCRTLQDMRRKGRYERYVASRRMDGFFKVDWRDHITKKSGEVEAALKVCKNCLDALDYEQYSSKKSSRNMIWTEFSIDTFFRDYSTFFPFTPSRTDNTALVDRYIKDWPRISRSTRNARGWTCECCRVNLNKNEDRKLLHVHHRNGVKTDNSDKNLEALCALCHNNRPMHGHMRVNPSQKTRIELRRVEQGINRHKCG